MYSPIKLDFLFYDFFMIFQNSIKINIKEKEKNRRHVGLKLIREVT